MPIKDRISRLGNKKDKSPEKDTSKDNMSNGCDEKNKQYKKNLELASSSCNCEGSRPSSGVYKSPFADGKDFDVTYKVLMLGDSGVGKTAMIRNLMGEDFNPNHFTTVGIDFVKRTFEIDGARVQLQIWDTAGQERFRSITKFQYRNAKGIVLVYDITDGESFDMLHYWMDSIEKDIDKNSEEPIPVFLVGNKCDLQMKRMVTLQQGVKLSEQSLCSGFKETSAKDNVNITDVFQLFAQSMLEVYNPKLMDSYMSPTEKLEKYESKKAQMTTTTVAGSNCNGNCACGGVPRSHSRFRLVPDKYKVKKKCCETG